MIGLLGNWRVMAVASAVSLAVGLGAGWSINDAFDAKTELKRQKAATRAIETTLRRTVAADAITADVGERSARHQAQIRTVYQDIIREVPTYVTVQADAKCDVPLGFVRLHDAAAAGSAPAAVPDASGPPNDAASNIALSAVAATVADNYGACRSDQSRLADLQDWIRAQAKEWSH